MTNNSKRQRMDGETALAFAGHCFLRLHPRETLPEWLSRCTTMGYTYDQSGDCIVRFAVTPTATNNAVAYFTVSVDSRTAITKVLSDTGWSQFSGEDLHGYHQP